jgi:hypothetical protein
MARMLLACLVVMVMSVARRVGSTASAYYSRVATMS